MRKIKTKGLKFKTKSVDKGPRFAIVLHEVTNSEKAKEGLSRVFQVDEALTEVVLSSAPVVVCRDLDMKEATEYAKSLRVGGDFRVWAESAAPRKIKQMNLKQKSSTGPMAAPQIRKH